MAKILAEEGPKTYDERDFAWSEDALRAWSGVGFYGGLILAEGLLLWMAVQGSLPGGPITIAGTGLLLCLCGFLPMLLGYTELGLALFGGGISTVSIAAAAANSSSGTNRFLDMGVLVAGVVLLTVGVVQSVRTYRAVGPED